MPKLLEMFKGTGSVGKQAKKMGFQVISLDFDPIYTPDIETDVLDWDYKKYSTENNYIPDMIWSSPPCNTFSPMVYRLKERDVETAKPISDRAKLGTKILYKTLEIIDYFRKKNPKLLFIIENPRGMMRKDPKMKKLARETTLYCLYGDFKRKPTDFWTNFPDGLQLDQETKQCPNATIPVQISKGIKNLNLDQRYSMPSKLIKHFLQLFKKQYGKKGAGIETDRFQEKGEVSLPEFQSVKVEVPTYMYKRLPDIVKKDGTTIPPPYRYKLVNPINSSRTIASRQKLKAVDIKRKPIPQPFTFYEESEELPILDEFSPEDQEKIEEYYKDVEYYEKKDRDEIEEQPSYNVPRGFPVTMYKTADRLGYKETSAKVYKAKEEKPKQEKSKPVKERKPRGRPKKPTEAKKEEEKEDIFQRLVKGLTEKSVEELSSRGSSKASSKKSSKTPSVISKLSSVSSLAKDSESSSEVSSAKLSEKSSKKSSKKAPSVASSIDKGFKLTDEEQTDLYVDDEDAYMLYKQDKEAFKQKYKKKYGIKYGFGIENNFSTKNKGMNSWIKYVKDFAAKKGIKYNEALKDPECKAGYKKLKGGEI